MLSRPSPRRSLREGRGEASPPHTNAASPQRLPRGTVHGLEQGKAQRPIADEAHTQLPWDHVEAPPEQGETVASPQRRPRGMAHGFEQGMAKMGDVSPVPHTNEAQAQRLPQGTSHAQSPRKREETTPNEQEGTAQAIAASPQRLPRGTAHGFEQGMAQRQSTDAAHGTKQRLIRAAAQRAANPNAR